MCALSLYLWFQDPCRAELKQALSTALWHSSAVPEVDSLIPAWPVVPAAWAPEVFTLAVLHIWSTCLSNPPLLYTLSTPCLFIFFSLHMLECKICCTRCSLIIKPSGNLTKISIFSVHKIIGKYVFFLGVLNDLHQCFLCSITPLCYFSWLIQPEVFTHQSVRVPHCIPATNTQVQMPGNSSLSCTSGQWLMKPGCKLRCSVADSGFPFSALVFLITDFWLEQLKKVECVFSVLWIITVSSASTRKVFETVMWCGAVCFCKKVHLILCCWLLYSISAGLVIITDNTSMWYVHMLCIWTQLICRQISPKPERGWHCKSNVQVLNRSAVLWLSLGAGVAGWRLNEISLFTWAGCLNNLMFNLCEMSSWEY